VDQLILDRVGLVYPRPAADPGAGGLVALADVSLTVERGEFVAVVGPSGCGKTSLLLLVNGLLTPTTGALALDGAPIGAPSGDRALVFQEAALLPWRTVRANVELGLELAGHPPAARRAAAGRHLRLVGLAGFEGFYPHQLSGGMRQRVGLARALAVEPRLLLMDEPFAALDAQLRQLMGVELSRIWERDRKTILFVTHDLDEAIQLADRVVVLSAAPGRVLDDVRIELPRPRGLEARATAGFAEYRRRLWARLEGEVVRALAAGRGPGDARR
jgi:NitT/TauT family transport system ATP-binding protein